MSRFFAALAVSALCVLLLAQCRKKEDKVFQAGFFTTKSDGLMRLFVNGNDKGVLPYFSAAPECGTSAGDGQRPLSLDLPSGEYEVIGRNSSNTVVSSGTMWIGTERNRVFGGTGGQSLSNNGTCVIIGLWE